MDFDLIRPCAKCPFRSDIEGYLRPERAQEIVNCLIVEDGHFPCHQTVDYDDEGDPISGKQHCAGALILLEKLEQPNQLMRIAERLGHYDASKLDMTAPVVSFPEDFVRIHGGEEEGEPCERVEAGCLAPAGFMGSGGPVSNYVAPGMTSGCENCGTITCDNCPCYCEMEN